MVGADKENVVTKLILQLNISSEDALELAERAEEVFLSKTLRTVVPERAFWLWVDLSKVIYSQGSASSGAADGGKVSSIKRGDTTIQYDHSSAAAKLNLTPSLLDRIMSWKVARAK